MRFQQKDQIQIAKEKHKDYSIKQFHGAGKINYLIYNSGKL